MTTWVDGLLYKVLGVMVLLLAWYSFKNTPLPYYAAHGVTSIIKLPNSYPRLFITFSFQLLQSFWKIQISAFNFLLDPSKRGQSKQMVPQHSGRQAAPDAAGPEGRHARIGVLWAPCCGCLYSTVQNHMSYGLSNGIIYLSSARERPEYEVISKGVNSGIQNFNK